MATSYQDFQVSSVSSEVLAQMDAYWRAANYLSVGQIYLLDNPLLKESLTIEHIKPRLLGHWGTTPGLNFINVHINRLITAHNLNMLFICGPGHGGPAMIANAWLEQTYSEYYPSISLDKEGMKALFKQFSFPGGVPSHVAPETPGSIHEGGELGYALAHAYGTVFDNPELITCCVIGDGEAETGPMAAAWHSNKFLNPARDGAVLPILHLNGYKIANPTILSRIDEEELLQLFEGYGYRPYVVEGNDPEIVHPRIDSVLDQCLEEIHAIQTAARNAHGAPVKRPIWPMVIMRTPKGWTGPASVDGKKTEDFWRSHQVPLANLAGNPGHIELLEKWLKSYRPEELFDQNGCPIPEILALAPKGKLRMTDSSHANGGLLLRDLKLPDYRHYAVDVPHPGRVEAEATRVMGRFLRDVMLNNAEQENFRIFGPDETSSNVGLITDRKSVV